MSKKANPFLSHTARVSTIAFFIARLPKISPCANSHREGVGGFVRQKKKKEKRKKERGNRNKGELVFESAQVNRVVAGIGSIRRTATISRAKWPA